MPRSIGEIALYVGLGVLIYLLFLALGGSIGNTVLRALAAAAIVTAVAVLVVAGYSALRRS